MTDTVLLRTVYKRSSCEWTLLSARRNDQDFVILQVTDKDDPTVIADCEMTFDDAKTMIQWLTYVIRPIDETERKAYENVKEQYNGQKRFFSDEESR